MKTHIIAAIVAICLACSIDAYGQMNQRDAEGRRQGQWQGTHPNGRLRYTGQFVDDKPVGMFRHFNPDGSARLQLVHEANNDTVKAVFFHRNGRNLGTGQFLNQQRTGLWTYFSEGGAKVSENSYVNGQIHGLHTVFYPSGAITETVEYDMGKKNGLWKKYFESGQLRIEATYLNDKLHGAFRAWHSNGIPLIVAEYHENLPHNKKVYFTENGETIKEQLFQKGELLRETVFIEQSDDSTVPLQPGNDPILEMIRRGI